MKNQFAAFLINLAVPLLRDTNSLEIAHSLGLDVIGVSFHVGSGCGDVAAYTTALN